MTGTWLAMLLAGAAGAGGDNCAGAFDTPHKSAGRRVETMDLLRLRDIGSSAAWAGSAVPFSVSPDRRTVAIQITRAHARQDDYCHALALVDPATGTMQIVDMWRGFLRQAYRHGRRLEGFENGVMRPTQPRWSPDGSSILYLKSSGSRAQLWWVAPGRTKPALIPATADVLNAAWLSPTQVIMSDTSRVEAAKAAIEAEGRSGHLYDDRFFPLRASTPWPEAPIEPKVSVVDLVTGMQTQANADQAERLGNASKSSLEGRARTGPGVRAWLAEAGGRLRLHAERLGGRRVCASPLCDDVIEFQPQDAAIVLLRREGWAKSGFGLYRWDLRTDKVRRLMTTDDFIVGCDPAPGEWICAREQPTRPRHLVRINPVTGRVTTLFDPNPDFPVVDAARVERIKVRSSAGAEAYADLVLPPRHRPGRRYPAVIVQYESRGFLRGGTGDEYPILAFADRGFAVLSVHRPADFATLGAQPATDRREYHRRNTSGWADRRHALSALLSTLDNPRVQAVVDPKRIGITGLSDGVGTVLFGLLNTDRFKTAIMSSCCEEATNIKTLMGPAFASDYRYAGFPDLASQSPSFWAPYSLKKNAARLSTPILMQMADREYLLGLESYAALQEAGAPVELYVFSDEYHVKWHPAHRLAIYDRSLRWMNFWLNGEEASDPRLAAERDRWRAMRRLAVSRSTPQPDPSLGIRKVEEPERIGGR